MKSLKKTSGFVLTSLEDWIVCNKVSSFISPVWGLWGFEGVRLLEASAYEDFTQISRTCTEEVICGE